jgi:hypothetical protein
LVNVTYLHLQSAFAAPHLPHSAAFLHVQLPFSHFVQAGLAIAALPHPLPAPLPQPRVVWQPVAPTTNTPNIAISANFLISSPFILVCIRFILDLTRF